ncbi:hypothetical protein [Acinetobacter sp. CFCC 10889]|uniref:hypothetical protein n=1 Tax=Acinetobacter sp. CFCC 10889 TaxID=1775557 RepID=UPI000DD0B468|nr:hypothetical protein [Acinetobacter sp. CFCC 10889]
MATDVDVQFFSHLNGLVLDNNWGDMIRLLDKALVTGIDFTEITAASIDDQGDVHITLYSAHNALLFQVVELSGFTPSSLNQKYRIKGTPSATELILKPSTAITEKNITTKGTGKLASLGYEIIFRDTGDVKRVYRAKNPRAEHPFIRVDESLTSPDGTTGVYDSSYAKYAMVGLLENMTHIDDYENPEVLQLPFDPTDPAKNWKITGTGEGVVRGWARWYWSRGLLNSGNFVYNAPDYFEPPNFNNRFTLIGGVDSLYLVLQNRGYSQHTARKFLYGLGVFNNALPNDVIPNWFLASTLTLRNASVNDAAYNETNAFVYNANSGYIITPKYDISLKKSPHQQCYGILPDYSSGYSNIYNGGMVSALEIPISSNARLLGSLKHVAWSGKNHNIQQTTPIFSENNMYVYDSLCFAQDDTNAIGGLYFHLGELE